MRVSMRVDEAICQAHGLCLREAPEVFDLQGDPEHAVVLVDPIPETLVEPARRALENCPEQAILELVSDGS